MSRRREPTTDQALAEHLSHGAGWSWCNHCGWGQLRPAGQTREQVWATHGEYHRAHPRSGAGRLG